MYEVLLSVESQEVFEQADRPLAKKLAKCFGRLESEPRRHNNIKKLTGELAGLYRFRIGDWRVVDEIHDELRQVIVLIIAHRSEVYD